MSRDSYLRESLGENLFPYLLSFLEVYRILCWLVSSAIFNVHHSNCFVFNHIIFFIIFSVLRNDIIPRFQGLWPRLFMAFSWPQWPLYMEFPFLCAFACVSRTVWTTWGQGCTSAISIPSSLIIAPQYGGGGRAFTKLLLHKKQVWCSAGKMLVI